MINSEPIGAIALADIIRPESKKAISMLKEMDIKCIVFTGDNKRVAKWVFKEIGLDEYLASLKILNVSKMRRLK